MIFIFETSLIIFNEIFAVDGCGWFMQKYLLLLGQITSYIVDEGSFRENLFLLGLITGKVVADGLFRNTYFCWAQSPAKWFIQKKIIPAEPKHLQDGCRWFIQKCLFFVRPNHLQDGC